MRRTLVACVAGSIVAGWAFAQEAKPAGAPDMRNMGPMARLPKKAQQDQMELKTFFKQWDAVGKKGDVNAMADMIDFPVIMNDRRLEGQFQDRAVEPRSMDRGDEALHGSGPDEGREVGVEGDLLSDIG